MALYPSKISTPLTRTHPQSSIGAHSATYNKRAKKRKGGSGGHVNEKKSRFKMDLLHHIGIRKATERYNQTSHHYFGLVTVHPFVFFFT